MGANKEFKDYCVTCTNCGKVFYPRYSSKERFCSIQCFSEFKKKTKYLEYLNNQQDWYGKVNMRWIKPHILEEQGGKCAICGINQMWNEKPLVFILDHIDGHANNNNRDNLRLICPNCDSQLDTYKSKNKKSDREYYHLHHR